MIRPQDPTSAMTGVFLILTACIGLILARNLSTFTNVGLGPGFAPRAIALVQIALGGALIVLSLLRSGPALEALRLRPLLVLVAIGFFAVTIERLGLVIAMSGLILLSCAAYPGTRWREVVWLTIGTVTGSAVIFVKLLGLSMPLWPPL